MKKIQFKNKKLVLLIVAVLLLGASAWIYSAWKKNDHEYTLETALVSKGSVSNIVTATGTLEATNTVVVGTQVSGVIEKLLVDFNTVVKKGQLIAELDKSTLQSSLENAQADVDNSAAEYDYQKANWERMKELYNKGLLSQSDYDLANYNYKKSKAAVKSSKADWERAARNLSYATIYSPIDGIVLNRAVEEGQTVTASMSTPELFTITNDLKEMQVEADIDEADIGMVKMHQRVEFSVDAFPDLNFTGEVSEIRLQPTESSNVITYTVIITVANPDLKLKPGMTASISIYVEEANDVLLLSSKSTRFTPERAVLGAYLMELNGDDAPKGPQGAPEGPGAQGPEGQEQELDDAQQVVWLKKGTEIRPVNIEIGVDDGSNFEVVSGLALGDTIITSLSVSNSDKLDGKGPRDGDQKSPFVQERSGNKGGGPGGPPR